MSSLAEAVAATAAELVAIPSLGGQEAAVLDHVAAWLGDAGVTVERRDVDGERLRSHPFHSCEVERDAVPVLLARVGSGAGPRLLLNAHVDVVAADPDAFAPRLEDGWLIGRGSADTKGGLAAAMHVLADLAGSGPLPGEVVLTPVVGEEDGGAGTLATLVDGLTADAAVVIEPTDLRLATASAGALSFRVTVPGRTAHGSVRHTGVSAIEKGWLVHRALLELEAERARRVRHRLYDADVPFPLCMGRIEGGDYRCDEAAWLRLEGRYGTAPHEPVGAARAELERAVAAAAAADPWLRDHPPHVEWIGAQWVGGDTDTSAAIVSAFRAADPALTPTGVPYGCDMGLLRQVADIPTVVYGPGSAGVAHTIGERVAVSDLGRAAEVLRVVALQLCAADQRIV